MDYFNQAINAATKAYNTVFSAQKTRQRALNSKGSETNAALCLIT